METANNNSEEYRIEILLKFYEAARTNVITRLSARDNSILLYIGGVAGIAAAAFSGGRIIYDLLLLIPAISAGIAAFTAQHNYVMDSLYKYIATDIIKKLGELKNSLIPWELSDTYLDGRNFSTKTRKKGEQTIILLPAIVSLMIYLADLINKLNDSNLAELWLKIILFLSSSYFCIQTLIVFKKENMENEKHLTFMRNFRQTMEHPTNKKK